MQKEVFEKEIFSEIMYRKNYESRKIFKLAVEEEVSNLISQYPKCSVTKEYYKGYDVKIRVFRMEDILKRKNIEDRNKEEELERRKAKEKEDRENGKQYQRERVR